MEYADLAIIDLSKAGTLEGRLELAKDVREALRNQGFFYVVNYGYTSAQVLQHHHKDVGYVLTFLDGQDI